MQMMYSFQTWFFADLECCCFLSCSSAMTVRTCLGLTTEKKSHMKRSQVAWVSPAKSILDWLTAHSLPDMWVSPAKISRTTSPAAPDPRHMSNNVNGCSLLRICSNWMQHCMAINNGYTFLGPEAIENYIRKQVAKYPFFGSSESWLENATWNV